ncbi:APC family permease [Nostocoides australiense]|nr:APC family permease [Tetrasphaera australiensis]
MSNPVQGALARRLGTGDAVIVGLSAMIGAGIFAAFPPAARAAGSWLLPALGTAALVALCNAIASAQLAQSYPSSGGTYLFGREVLGPWWGYAAGWGFVVGKTASCAAMAMTFAAYAVPAGAWGRRLVAVVAVVVLTGLNLRGVTRTAYAARILLGITGIVLAGLLVLLWSQSGAAPPGQLVAPAGGVFGVLQGAGLLFFAFAGYARIATLAEEVRRPQLLTRAILIALGITMALYLAIGTGLVRALGAALPGTDTPLALAVEEVGAGWYAPVVRVGAAAASLGALLALLAGVTRTGLAMARERDLPTWLASVDPRFQVPDHAQVLLGVVVSALVLVADLRGAIGFSSFGVLIYYAVANLAALRQPIEQRRSPRLLQLIGLIGCLALVGTLPPASVLAGLAVFAVGIVGRLLLRSENGGGH